MEDETLHNLKTLFHRKIRIFHILHLKSHFKIGLGEKYINVHNNIFGEVKRENIKLAFYH